MACPGVKHHFVKQNQDWQKSRGYSILKIKGSKSLDCSAWRRQFSNETYKKDQEKPFSIEKLYEMTRGNSFKLKEHRLG